MNEQTREYIRRHAADDVRQLALRGSRDAAVDLGFALQQIDGRQRARRKLPSWAAVDAVVYPPHLSMEQCSSEQTARYKAQVVARLLAEAPRESGRPTSMVDLTGGFGVDFAFLAPLFSAATYVERNPQLFAISSQNLPLFVNFVNCVCDDAAHYWASAPPVTLCFLDPARRDEHGARTYAIGDCTPDVLALRDALLAKADWVLLKLSPMLDWRKAVADLGRANVREVHIVSVAGECKELLLVLRRPETNHDGIGLFCASDDRVFALPDAGEAALAASPPAVGSAQLDALLDASGAPADSLFLYEPNASVMKAGCFAVLSARFGVRPLAPNSHLFISAHSIDDFPGRRFRVERVSTLNKRELRARLGGLRSANVSVRNFPLSVADLRRRLRLADGGPDYLFGTTLADDAHILMVCRKA